MAKALIVAIFRPLTIMRILSDEFFLVIFFYSKKFGKKLIV